MSIYPGVITGSIDHDGVPVGFHDGGQSGSGPVIVLVHGTGGRTETHFFTLYPMLASRHRVIGVDLSDQEPGGGPLTVAGLVAQVKAVLDARVPGQEVVLAGYSLGSCVAAATAGLHPELVSSLVMLNGWATTDNALRLRLSLWRRLYEQWPAEGLAEFMMLNVYGRAFLNSIPYIGPRPWSQLEEMRAAYVVGPGSDRQMRLNASLDISHLLSGIRARTLVIGSSGDQLIPLEHSRELFGAIQDARIAEIGGGHGSVTERPAEIFHLIDRFVREPQAWQAGSVVGDDAVLQLNRL